MDDRKQFFTTIYESIGTDFWLELRSIKRDTEPMRQFVHGLDFERIDTFVAKSQKEKREAYFGVAARKNSSSGAKSNCSFLPGLWVDVDFKDTPKADVAKRLAECPLKPSITVHSGGGLHLYYIFKEPIEAVDGAEKYLKALSRFLGGDQKAAEVAHVLRIPETKNFKYTEPRPVKVANINGARYAVEDFELFLTPENEEKDNARNALGWEKQYLNGSPLGERNNAAARLAGKYMRMGLQPEEVLSLLRGVNLKNEADNRGKQLSDNEIQATVASIFKSHPREEIQADYTLNCLERNADGDASLFIDLNLDHLCYDHSTASWYTFNKHHWQPDTRGHAVSAIQGLITAYGNEAKHQLDLMLKAAKGGEGKETIKSC